MDSVLWLWNEYGIFEKVPYGGRVLRNASAMIAEREALRKDIEHLTVLFPTVLSSFDFQVENSGRTVQYKLNAQSLHLLGLHSDVTDAHRAGANRLQTNNIQPQPNNSNSNSNSNSFRNRIRNNGDVRRDSALLCCLYICIPFTLGQRVKSNIAEDKNFIMYVYDVQLSFDECSNVCFPPRRTPHVQIYCCNCCCD